jgi:hypothetical protein
MGNTLDPWNEFLEIPKTHQKLIDLSEYLLRTCGGFVWPLLYFCSLKWGWDSLNILGRILFIMGGCALTPIGILYPYAWILHKKRMSNEHQNTIEVDANNLLGAIERMYHGELSYGPFEQEALKLNGSLRKFRENFFKEEGN